jgi:hypothetical protein
LDRGAIVARTLKGDDGRVGVFAISRIDVPADTLVAHARAIADLKRSSFVTAIKRFSDPPTIDDLDELVLSPRDRQAAADCRVGKCSFKFTAAEIAALRGALAAGGMDRDEVIHTAFRQIVLARVNAYLAAGLAGFPDIVNRSEWLRDVPKVATPVESFLYWSQENYGPGKPVILVTHVGIIPPESPGDPAIVLGHQVLATRYMTGGLSMMAITTERASGARYLVYLNRTSVDLLGGFFGPLKRAALESRLKGELPEIILKLRARLERAATITR